MLRISNGMLKLNIEGNGMDFLWDMSLLLIFVTATVLYPAVSSFNQALQWLGYGLLAFVTFAEIFSRKPGGRDVKLHISLLTIWYGLFMLFSYLSVVWAQYAEGVFYYSNALIKVFLLGFCLSQHIDTEEKLNKSMKLFIFASIIMFFYSLIMTPREEWFMGFLGDVTGNSISTLGLCGAFAMVMSVYFAMALDKKLYYVAAAINFIFVVAATSRKALVFAILGVVLLEVLYTWRRNYALSLIIILAAMGLFAFLVLKSGISNAMNRRMLGMYNYFTDGGGKRDTSISIRMYYIATAKKLFLENPMLGVGLGNFSYVLDDLAGNGVYAHNNYMEIVADLGLVGVIVYYWFYIYLVIKLLGQTLRRQKLSLLYLVLMILFMAVEYGQVTYYQHIFQFIIAFAYCAVCISDGVYAAEKAQIKPVEN